MKNLAGETVDFYQVEQFLARGGMADVYLAVDTRLRRKVALKVMLSTLKQEPTMAERFQREAETVARLNHPNIVQIYTTGVTSTDQPYLAMQYVEGGTLHNRLVQLVQEGRRPRTEDVLVLVRQVAAALSAAHRAGIVHRDLKPSNILLQTDGTPILTDLGIAAVSDATSQLTRAGGVIGTPNYMSPEQAKGEKLDGRSDIYSLGVILYEMLAGEVPFASTSPVAVLHQHAYEPHPPLIGKRADLSATTYRLVDRCLEKEPANRFRTAEQLMAALDRAIADERSGQVTAPSPPQPAPQPPPAPTPVASSSGGRSLWLYGLLGLILVGGMIGMGYAFFGGDDSTPVSEVTVTSTAVLSPTLTTATETPTSLTSTPTAAPPTVTPTTAAAPPTPIPPVVQDDVTAVFLSTPPEIDGDIGDWPNDIVPYLSAFRVYNDAAWNGTEDVDAVWRLGWDNDNLYLIVTVVDDVHVQINNGVNVFRGDSIDLQIDADLNGDFGATSLSPDDYQIILSPGDFTSFSPEAVRMVGSSNGQSVDAPGSGIVVWARPAANGYIVEAAIPWASLNVTPAPNLSLGIALNVTDNDTPNTRVQEVFMSHVAGRTFSDPTSWGTLTLR